MALRRTESRSSAETSPHDVYSLTCICGEFLTGDRDTHPLIIECPECGSPLYILPRDVYPRPKVLKPEPDAPADAQANPEAPEFRILEVEDDNQRLAEPKDDTPPRIWIDQPRRGALVRKRIFQVSGMILVLLLATWWGITRRAQRTEAEATFFEQSEAAWEFVADAEWEEARIAAEAAVTAADFLGREDPASREIRDLHAELLILSRLSSKSLIEIVLEKQQENTDPKTWESLFSARHGGNWLLMEGTIVRQVTDDEPRYHLEYPVSLSGQHVDLVWEEPVALFDELNWTTDRYPVFIAVRMEGIRVDEDDPDSWSIILSADDVRFWTTPSLLTEALGVDLDSQDAESLRRLIESQLPPGRFKYIQPGTGQDRPASAQSPTDLETGDTP